MKNTEGMPNLSQGQIEMLLRLASQKMGVTPEKLMTQLKGGEIPKGLNISAVKDILADPKKLEALLNSDKAKAALQSLMNNK